MDYLFTAFKRYAEFSGRSRRLEYGLFLVVVFLISAGLAIIERSAGMASPATGAGPLSAIFGLIALLPGIAVGIRRLHDFNATGWWYLLALVPLVNLILVLVLLFKEGTAGPNRFGLDPKAVEFQPDR